MAGNGHGSVIEMDLRANELARRLVYRQKLGVAAREMGLSIRMARTITRKPEFQAIINLLKKQLYEELDVRAKNEIADVQTKAREASGEAIDKLISLMRHSASEGMQRDCANDVIKHAGASEAKAPTLNLQSNQFTLLLTAIKETDDDGRHRTP